MFDTHVHTKVSTDSEMEIEDAIKSLEEKFSIPPGRMTEFNGKKNSILIDSSLILSLNRQITFFFFI